MATMVGLRIRNRITGALVLDITDRLTRVLGQITVSANGSLQDDGLKTGDFWYTTSDNSDGVIMQGQVPIVACNKQTGVMTWSYNAPSYIPYYTSRIVYGIY